MTEATGGVDEFSPLISNNNKAKPRRPAHRSVLSVTSITSIQIPKAHNHTALITLICLIVFFGNSAGGFIEIPQARLVENILCQQYYNRLHADGGPIDDEMCKVEPVQSKMAFILAILAALNAIVGFWAAFPWSLVADRVGRKPVMALCIAGISLSIFWTMLVLALPGVFTVSLVWLGSLTGLIGGGTPVLAASIYSMLTDATTDGERAVTFLRLHMAALCGELFSPSLASFLMERTGPWPSLWLGASLLAACAVAVLFLPETSKSVTERPSPEEEQREEDEAPSNSRPSQLLKRFKDSALILQSPSLILLLIACLATSPFTASTSTFMVQFISRRYQLKLEQGGYIQSFYGGIQAIQCVVILPLLSKLAMRGNGSSPSFLRPADPHHRDLIFLRWSSFLIVIASLNLGLAPNLPTFISGLVILAFGTGYGSLIRTLLTLYVDPEHVSRMFGIVSMIEIVGSIYARPMLAELFSLGMKLGGQWIGLPYYGLTVLFAMLAVLFWFIRVPGKPGGRDPSCTEE